MEKQSAYQKFHSQTSARKTTVDTDNKTAQGRFNFSAFFLLCSTAQIDAAALLGSVSKTTLLIFRVLLCNILNGFPRHVHT